LSTSPSGPLPPTPLTSSLIDSQPLPMTEVMIPGPSRVRTRLPIIDWDQVKPSAAPRRRYVLGVRGESTPPPPPPLPPAFFARLLLPLPLPLLVVRGWFVV
jgi:hypothetical protein